MVGFLGAFVLGAAAPLLDAFARNHPNVDMRWHEIGFPPAPPRSIVDDVDVALLWGPPAGHHPDLSTVAIHREQRVVVMASSHPFASRGVLQVQDVIDETYPGFEISIDASWMGFWYLNERRGSLPRLTNDMARTPEEVAGIVASGGAITTTATSVARRHPHPHIVDVPLADAEPAVLSLIWRRDANSPLIDVLVTAASDVVATRP